MPRTIIAGIALAMSLLTYMLPLQAQTSESSSELEQIAELEQQSRDAFETQKWARVYVANLKLNKLRPGESQYLVDAVRACGMLDRKSTAYHLMLLMQQQGMSFDFNNVAETEQIRQTEAYQHINNLLIEAGKPAGVGIPVFTLEGKPSNFHSIAWDPSREKFLVGTLEQGEILAVSENGQVESLVEAGESNGLWAVTGLAVDGQNNRLWVSSSAMPVFSGYSEADNNRGALVEMDLETLEVKARYLLPGDELQHELGSVATADDGTTYVIDRKAATVYLKAPGSDQLVSFFTNPELTGLTDIAVAGDNSKVFVSDSAKGVLVIDPVSGEAAFLSGPDTMNLGGILGIEYSDGKLFVIQGGFQPQRVVRLELDGESGLTVKSISPMATGQDGFDRPGVATIRGDNLYYYANSGATGETGAIVFSTPLDAGVEVAPPDMSPLQDAVRAKSQSQ